jgi:hypothetical protein
MDPPIASALAPPARKLRRLKTRCSGVARRSDTSQPRRRITFIGNILQNRLPEVKAGRLTGKSRFCEKNRATGPDFLA